MAALAETIGYPEEETARIYEFPQQEPTVELAEAETDTDAGFDYTYSGEIPGIPPTELFRCIVKAHQFDLKYLGRQTIAQGELQRGNTTFHLLAHQVERISPVKDRPGVTRIRFNEPVPTTVTRAQGKQETFRKSAIIHVNSIEQYSRTIHFQPRQ